MIASRFVFALPALLLIAGCRPAPRPSCELQELAINAATGDARAQYNLAVEFYTGRRIARDYGKAAALWRQAAAQGDPTAKSNLGFLTYHGYGVRADPAAAVRLLTEAADAGEVEANYHLGVAASEGKGMERSSIEAYARFRAAELRGSASRDGTAEKIAESARAELRELEVTMPARERDEGEARARRYAAAPPATGTVP